MEQTNQIRQLQSKDHDINVFPLTVEDAVFDENGVQLSEKLEGVVIGAPVEEAEPTEYPYLTSSDIADNLDTTATNKPLSANQGNRLKKAVVKQNNYELNVYADTEFTTAGVTVAANNSGYFYIRRSDYPARTFVITTIVLLVMDSNGTWLPLFVTGYTYGTTYLKVKVYNPSQTAQTISKANVRFLWQSINPNDL